MADDNITSRVNIEFNASQALGTIKRLQSEITAFHANLTTGAGASASAASEFQKTILNSVNATKGFSASVVKIASETEAFTKALERNDFTMRQYFRNAMGSIGKFGGKYKSEFDTIQQVAESRVRTLQTQFIKLGRDANGALRAIQIRPATLDLNDFATKAAIATQKTQIFHELVAKGSTQILNWGKNTQWAGRQLMVGFTIPLTMMAASASKAFMELERQTISFKRVYGDFNTSAKQTDMMAESVKKLAAEFTQYGVAVTDTMGLAAKAAAMGKQGQDLISQVTETTRLAVLGNVDQQQALDTTISLTNAFGVAAKDLATNIDFLNAVENQTVTSIEDLTVAIPKAGPVIKQMGGDVKDLAFFLTAMKEGGINASEGANALKSGIAAIINPTKAASDMLASYGINIQKLIQSNKGDVKGLITDFASALDKLDPLNRAKAIEQMFGKFQFARISTLFQNVIAQGSQANKVLQLTNATTEELANLSKKELDKVAESTTYKFQKAMADFQMAIAPIGETFLKFGTFFLNLATGILNWFNKLDDGFKTFVIALTVGLGAVIPLVIMLSGLFANLFASVASRINSIAMFFKGIGKAAQDGVNSTRYLSEAELKAQAVAASLDQTHAQLNQTFGLQVGLLDELAAAYGRVGEAMAPVLSGGTLAEGAMSRLGYGVANDVSMKGYTSAAYFSPGSWNLAMDRSGGIPTADLSSYIKQGGAASMAPLLAAMADQTQMGLNDPRFTAEWKAAGDHIAGIVTTTLDNSAQTIITDADFERIVVPEIKRQAANIQVAGVSLKDALTSAFDDIRTISATGRGRHNISGSSASTKNREQAAQFAIANNPKMYSQGTDKKGNKVFLTTHNGATQQAHQAHMQLTKTGLASGFAPIIGSQIGETEMRAFLARLGVQVGDAVEGGVTTGAVAGATAAAPKVATTLGQAAQRGLTASDFKDPGILKAPQGPSSPIGNRPPTGFRISKFGAASMIAGGVGAISSMIPGAEIVTQIAFATSAVAGIAEVVKMLNISMAGIKAGFLSFAGALGGLALPLTLVVGGLLALGFAIAKHNEDMNKIIQDTIDQNNKLGASYQAMQKIAETTGKALASQVLAKRQSDIAAGITRSEPGKLTYGEKYLTTEAGKAIAEQVGKSVQAGISSSNIGSLLGQQLAASIASGLMSEDQARSIATALGQSLKNTSIQFGIEATLDKLLLSNGKDALTQGVDLRINLIQDIASKIPGQISAMTGISQGQHFQNVMSGFLQGNKKFNDALNEKVYTPEQIAASQGLFISQSAAALAQQKEQTAATQLQYESELKILQAKKDQDGIDKLNNEYAVAKQKLLENNLAVYDKIKQTMESYTGDKSVLSSQYDTAITTTYAGTGQQDFATSAIADLATLQDAGAIDLALQIKAELVSGVMMPSTVTNIMNMFTDPKNAQNHLQLMMDIDATYGAGTSDSIQGILDAVGANKTLQQQAIIMIEAQGQDALDALNSVFGDTGTTAETKRAIISYIALHPEKVKDFKNFANMKNPVKKAKMIFETLGWQVSQSSYREYARMPDYKKKVFETEYRTVYTTIGSKAAAANRSSGGLFRADTYENRAAHTAESRAIRRARRAQNPGTTTGTTNGGSNGGGGGGGGGGRGGGGGGGASDSGGATKPEDTSSFLKDVVDSIRKLEDAGQGLPTTFANAMKAITNFSNTGSIAVGGLADKLRLAGANANLIELALKATPEELKNIFKGSELTDFGKKLQEVLNSLQVSSFIDTQKAVIQVSNDQANAFVKLRQNGMEAASAYGLIEDQALASAIANAKNVDEINAVIQAYYAAKKAADQAMDPNQLAIKRADLVNGVSEARIGQYQTGLDIISLQEDEINKKYEDRKAALDKIAQANDEITRQQQQQLDIADALSKGDISAAARAAQAMRKEAAASAQKRQQTALDDSRQAELKAIQVEINGTLLTREEIEKRIKDLNASIYQIQLSMIDAAKVQIAQDQLAQQEAVDNASTDITAGTTSGGTDGGAGTTTGKIAYKGPGGKRYYDAPKPANWDTMGKKKRMNWKKEHTIKRFKESDYSEVLAFARGGYVNGKGPAFNKGSMFRPIGVDKVPAMVRPGEFIVSVPGVKKFGVDRLKQINSGQSIDGTVYNYNVTVNAGNSSNGEDIAKVVIGKIKEIDSMRVRGNRL